jgi:hypothetical protein
MEVRQNRLLWLVIALPGAAVAWNLSVPYLLRR